MTEETQTYNQVEIETAETTTTTTYAPRGARGFTDSQRIIIAVLLWLNILVLVVGYLILSGQLTV